MIDPFSAVVRKLSRRDSTSNLIALLLGFALATFVIAASASDVLRWVLAAAGLISFSVGLLAFVYAFLVKPERLRSEETVQMDMVLTWLNRPDVDDAHRSAAARLLPLVLEKKQPKTMGSYRSSRGEDDV